MKLYLSLCVALSLLGSVLSGPLEDFEFADMPYFQPDSANSQQFPLENVNEATYSDEEIPMSNTNDNMMSEQDSSEIQGNANYADEIKVQVEAQRPEPAGEDAEVQKRAVTHGAVVAFQTQLHKRPYLACSVTPCRASSLCPGLYMEGEDWKKCGGEVFQIYRAYGPGHVRAGDIVGIYFPHERKWLGLSGGSGQRTDCPGHPTKQFGFQDPRRWYHCVGEVFAIYARGKPYGHVIKDHDDVMFYSYQGHSWVSVAQENVRLDGCPGGRLPPAPDRYDACWGETFELFLR